MPDMAMFAVALKAVDQRERFDRPSDRRFQNHFGKNVVAIKQRHVRLERFGYAAFEAHALHCSIQFSAKCR